MSQLLQRLNASFRLSEAGSRSGSLGRGRVHESAVLSLAATVYFGGRVLVEGGSAAATKNAQRLVDLERSLGIDFEVDVHEFALRHDAVRVVGNVSYVWLHWPLLLAALWLLFAIDRERYLQLRNAMFASGVVGLALFATFPMAPPRFMPGFVGTVSDEARRHYLDYPLSWTNQFAAFPSFHVGWTLIACLALASSVEHPTWRWFALIPSAMVSLAVISTANHYAVDATVGGAIAVIAYWWFGRSTRRV